MSLHTYNFTNPQTVKNYTKLQRITKYKNALCQDVEEPLEPSSGSLWLALLGRSWTVLTIQVEIINIMLLVLMSSWCWSWFLPGWGGRELCWQYRSRILRSFFKMLILIIDYCRMRSWTVLTIQVHVIVHDADVDVFIMLIMILDRNNSYNITNNCEYCPGPSLTVSHNIAKP